MSPIAVPHEYEESSHAQEEETSFEGIPPFPNTVPTAPLLRISLSKLLSGDKEEEERVWDASRKLGFFYLDLRLSNSFAPSKENGGAVTSQQNGNDGLKGLNGNELLKDADQLFGVGKEIFELPTEEKQRYDFKDQGSYFGYKGLGEGVVDKSGNKDRNEFYNVSKDDILKVSESLPAPDLLKKYNHLLESFITKSHTLTHLILSILNSHLALPPRTLENLHRLHSPSGDQVRFVRAPPQPPLDRRTALGAHTDFGSVTVLFNRVGGLMVRLPKDISPIPPEVEGVKEESFAGQEEGEQWVYVNPLPGHCIINLGDALVKFSAGVLRSNIHRVVSPPGQQAGTTRYSLVYFSRAEDEVLLRPLVESEIVRERVESGKGGREEEVLSSKEWVLKRALGRRGVGKFEDSVGTEGVRG